ncbi:probable methyltransferase-like protein 24 [Palaemon carinicauda]|uniref:probable methyltransferase-like protein 24 n=1 Tax=Palaemon carinicauda TaxID=392227 RepID=UPI0035B5D972
MALSMASKRALLLVALFSIAAFGLWRPFPVYMIQPETRIVKEIIETHQEPREECLTLLPCPVPTLVSNAAFAEYERQKQYPCMKFEYFGIGDGGKGVCLDSVFNLNKDDCHVLSFGISKDWTFDEAFGKFGCKVVSFDPTIKKEDHQHSENVRFLNLGISNKNESRNSEGWTINLDTYENILKRIGLLDSVIDYLKIDVERAELKFFEDVFANTPHLLKNVKQIGMETHYGGKGVRERFWSYYHLLACIGFKIVDARQYGGRTEIVWVRP